MLHYEVALTIIGVIVTVIGILIAFDITFSSQMFLDLFKEALEDLPKMEDLLKTKENDRVKRLIESTRIKDSLRKPISILKRKAFAVFSGIFVILVLVLQTFAWEIELITNKISNFNFWIFSLLFILAFIWIGNYIYGIFSFNWKLFKSLLSDLEEIEESE